MSELENTLNNLVVFKSCFLFHQGDLFLQIQSIAI